ncbi:MAG: PQQ-binding-like beta-propeller repeat protein [Candidatus Latescibacterota bacterium]|nr:PQQ-binding-like beta-propeller repeat protein [Candidatus Latescibacterota bacterium]
MSKLATPPFHLQKLNSNIGFQVFSRPASRPRRQANYTPLSLTTVVVTALLLALGVVSLVQAEPRAFAYTLAWKRVTGSCVVQILAESEDQLWYGSTNGAITSLERDSGRKRWMQPSGTRIIGAAAQLSSRRLYVADANGAIRALDTRSGEPQWTRQLYPGRAHLSLSRHRLLVLSADGVANALDPYSGESLWRVRTGVRPQSPAVEQAGTVFLAASGGRVLAISAETGRHRRAVTPGEEVHHLVATPNGIVVAGDERLWGLTAELETRWEHWLGSDLVEPPTVARDVLVCPARNGWLYGIDAATGELRWKHEGDSQATLSRLDTAVVASSGDGRIARIRVEDGTITWSLSLRVGETRTYSGRHGRLYLSSADGRLHALDPIVDADSSWTWWQSISGGESTGYLRRRSRTLGDQLLIEEESLSWARGFVRRRSELRLDAETLRLDRVNEVTTEGRQRVQLRARRKGSSLHVERRLGDAREQARVKLKGGEVPSAALMLALLRRGREPGRRDTVLLVNYETAQTRPIYAIFGAIDDDGLQPLELRHGPVLQGRPHVADLPRDLIPRIPFTVWIDAAGAEARSQAALLGVHRIRSAPRQAMTWHPVRTAKSITLDREIRAPDQLDFLRFALPISIGSLEELFVLEGRQKLTKSGTDPHPLLTVHRAELPSNTPNVSELGEDADLAVYLEPSLFVQSDYAGIRRQAKILVPVPTQMSALDAARAIHDWVYDEMVPGETNVRFKSAVEVFAEREGTCSEYTVLYAALCRAAGLPARITTGYALSRRGELILHIWPQVWVGEWLEVDPSWNAFPVDAAHIKTGEGRLVPAAVERLNMPLQWLAAYLDTLSLRAYADPDGLMLAEAEVLHEQAEEATRYFRDEEAVALLQELAHLPWNVRTADALLGIARHYVDRGQLAPADSALADLRRGSADAEHRSAGILLESRVAAARAQPERMKALLEEIGAYHPDTDRADEALARLAEIVENEQGCAHARPLYEQLVERYAVSGWAAVAEGALERCAEEAERAE